MRTDSRSLFEIYRSLGQQFRNRPDVIGVARFIAGVTHGKQFLLTYS